MQKYSIDSIVCKGAKGQVYVCIYIYIYIRVYIYIYIHTRTCLYVFEAAGSPGLEPMLVHEFSFTDARVPLCLGRDARSTRHRLDGYLVLQGNIPLRTSQVKHVLKLLARKRLGTRWAKYPCSRCRSTRPAGRCARDRMAIGLRNSARPRHV